MESTVELALGADLMTVRAPGRHLPARAEGVTFADWLRDGAPTTDDLDYHLTTLFPPVRSRGWFEVRYLDALPDPWWRVAVAVTAAVLDDDLAADAARAACEPVEGRWVDAARDATGDPALAAAALATLDAAVDALPRMGAAATVPLLQAYRERWTGRGRCPADDVLDAHHGGADADGLLLDGPAPGLERTDPRAEPHPRGGRRRAGVGPRPVPGAARAAGRARPGGGALPADVAAGLGPRARRRLRGGVAAGRGRRRRRQRGPRSPRSTTPSSTRGRSGRPCRCSARRRHGGTSGGPRAGPRRARRDPVGGRDLLADGFVYGMVVQHEHQHDETMLATLQLRGGPRSLPPDAPLPPGRPVPPHDDVASPPGAPPGAPAPTPGRWTTSGPRTRWTCPPSGSTAPR